MKQGSEDRIMDSSTPDTGLAPDPARTAQGSTPPGTVTPAAGAEAVTAGTRAPESGSGAAEGSETVSRGWSGVPAERFRFSYDSSRDQNHLTG